MKKLWDYLKIAITVGVVAIFIFYFLNNKDDFNSVVSVPATYLLALFILKALEYLINGLFILVILGSFDKKMAIIESFYVSVISSLGNYFLPMRGGAVIRSVYLKKKFDFPYSHFISTLYGNYIIIFLLNSFIGLLSLLVIGLKYQFVSIPLTIFFGLLFLGMLFLSAVNIRFDIPLLQKLEFINFFRKKLNTVLDGWRIIRTNKKLVFTLFLLTASNFILITISYILEFDALKIQNSFVNIVLYNCLSSVSLLASLTPGSLGIREGIFLLTSNILNITNEQVMQLALLDRGILLITIIFLFISLSTWRFILKKPQ
jgi:uncharacterized protein (TIRG00374 family)